MYRIILLMKNGDMPWSINEWFNECMYYAAVGYSEAFNLQYAYYVYDGNQFEGDHSFSFLW